MRGCPLQPDSDVPSTSSCLRIRAHIVCLPHSINLPTKQIYFAEYFGDLNLKCFVVSSLFVISSLFKDR